ncbi:MAG: dnaJ 1 [Planctomycetaceae bacterium]|nr:dnaJ 1 [Planctomycetaceae bacterium]
MSDHVLPESLADWPHDPCTLLGVPQDVDERSLKRAYTKLIRVYKPEHHPDKFARVREAYEQILQRIEYLAQFNDSPAFEVGDQPIENPHAESTEPRDPTLRPRQPSERNRKPSSDRLPDLRQQIGAAWQWVLDENPAAGYRQLQKLLESHPANEEICIRLYWIVRLAADVDPETDPTRWLCLALRQHRLTGRAWELYCRELERQPLLGANDNCSMLLRGQIAEQRITELAIYRWRAVALANRWSLIRGDLDELQQRFASHDSVRWAQLLLGALDFACWSESTNTEAQELVNYCDLELRQLPELQLQMVGEFDRLDILKQLTQELATPSSVPFPASLANVIRDYLTVPSTSLRPPLLQILEQWTLEPRTTLREMDQLANRHRLALQQLSEIILRLERNEYRDDPQLRVNYIYRAFRDDEVLNGTKHAAYEELRLVVFNFCIAWQIHFGEIMWIFSQDGFRVLDDESVRRLGEDVSLRTVLEGIDAFWASTSWQV